MDAINVFVSKLLFFEVDFISGILCLYVHVMNAWSRISCRLDLLLLSSDVI